MSDHPWRAYDPEISRGGIKAQRRRFRLLRRYIESLTVAPVNLHDVFAAIAFDFTTISDHYGGSFDRAIGDGKKPGNASDAQNGGKESD